MATFDDDTSVFVKAAVDDDTERWLRTDLLVMSTLDDLVPEIVAWTEADGRPVLLIEDLHDAHWPADHMRTQDRRQHPVWRKPGQLDLLFSALERLAAIPAPTSLARLSATHQPRWPRIAADPERLLRLGLCDAVWLDRVFDDLVAAEDDLDLDGDRLVHHDVRSDNVCFRGERVILVDWSDARRGHPRFDLANLLQGLPLEGGPDPYDVMPDGGPFAAWSAADHATEPPPRQRRHPPGSSRSSSG